MEANVNATTTDYHLPDQIDDTISQLRWLPSPNNHIVASCGWDAKVRVWNVNYQPGMGSNPTQINSNLAFNTQLADPLLSLCWQPDSSTLFVGGCDGTINYMDLAKGQTAALGKHEIGCKELAWIPNMNILLSGGWDGKLNFWDLRQNTPVMQLDVGRKIYTMSLSSPLLVVGMSDRMISYYNLNKLSGTNFTHEAIFESHLRYQTRRVACFPDKDGYAIGSIEGRVAIKYIDLNKTPEINPETKSMNSKDDFAFRCHRTGENMAEVYPVNDISFNHAYGTFCTAGGDGSWIIWDKDSRSRLKQGSFNNKIPMTAVDYSANGDLLAYATGYDWAKGIAYEKSFQPKLSIHYCPDSDKQKKKKK
jgi:mRNA export factor